MSGVELNFSLTEMFFSLKGNQLVVKTTYQPTIQTTHCTNVSLLVEQSIHIIFTPGIFSVSATVNVLPRLSQ